MMTVSEILAAARALRAEMVAAGHDLPDAVAPMHLALFDEWKAGIKQSAGMRQVYNGELWKVKDGVADFTSQADWTPDVAVSLYERVANPAETGTKDNPISYAQMMEIKEGKYYKQSNVVYYCFRDMPAMAFDLSALVEQFVRVAE